MKHIWVFILLLSLWSCDHSKLYPSDEDPVPVNWKSKRVEKLPDSLYIGSTYLPVYSQIYSLTEHRTHNLTATVSLRNTSKKDSLFISSVNFYDTHGQIIKSYIDYSILLKPLETIDLVINEADASGGTGGSFVFDWQATNPKVEPLFEAIMISTMGQQGLSFTTRGVRVQ